jgi:Transposase DDE domain
MRRSEYVRGSVPWQGQAVALLLRELPLVDYGRLVTRHTIARVLVWMCAARATASAASLRTSVGVSDETIRKALVASLPEIEELPRLVRASLSPALTRLRKAGKKRGFDVAIDVHHQPYYGQRQPGIVRGKARQGTKSFWSVATAAIVHRGERLTLAVVPVTSHRGDEVLANLWPQLKKLRLKIRRLLLDRGFYSAEVVTWLQERRIWFVMPMVRRGLSPRSGRPGSGTAPFFVRGRRGITTYRWKQRRRRRRWITVNVAIVPAEDRRRRPLVYAFAGRLPNLEYCRRIYKRRFAIETSYRQARQSRAWTTSRDPRRRRLLVVLSFVICNLWLLNREPRLFRTHNQRLTYALYLDLLIQLIQFELTQTTRGPPHAPIVRLWIY